ncbi:MAG: hypothetical protein WBI40_05260, partial [Methylococcaceae bacterium]
TTAEFWNCNDNGIPSKLVGVKLPVIGTTNEFITVTNFPKLIEAAMHNVASTTCVMNAPA